MSEPLYPLDGVDYEALAHQVHIWKLRGQGDWYAVKCENQMCKEAFASKVGIIPEDWQRGGWRAERIVEFALHHMALSPKSEWATKPPKELRKMLKP